MVPTSPPALAASLPGADAAAVPRRYSAVTVAICMAATWIVPGAGHWLLGRRAKAWLYFAVLTAMFLIGLVLAEFRAVRSDEDFFLYLLGEGGYAGLAFPTLWLTRGLELASELPRLEVGRLFATVAGLMNVVVIVDVFETARPREGDAAPAGAAERAEAGS